MSTEEARGRKPEIQAPLTRERILRAALDYIDGHGLAGLSMHKLGAELGVKAMSLYYYVQNKDDILDSLVGLLWGEIDPETIEDARWHDASRMLAHALRSMVHRHPHSAPLVMNRRTSSAAQLRVYAAYLAAVQAAGFDPRQARKMLRILVAYGFGYAQTELAAFAPPGDQRRGEGQVDLPADLLDRVRDVCGGSDTAADFDFGLDLMLRGLHTG